MPEKASIRMKTDSFAKFSACEERQGARRQRPLALQSIIDGLCGLLLADGSAIMSKFEGGKLFHLLQKSDLVRIVARSPCSDPMRESVVKALDTLPKEREEFDRLAHGIRSLVDELTWYRGATGPFASANFDTAHAHAVLVGPEGIEERSDIRIGLTVIGTYTRFPDQMLTENRVFLALSEGDYHSHQHGWRRQTSGSSLYCPGGTIFAMRSTARPMLSIWGQRLRS